MKRLALLASTAILALLLTACGDNTEKKVEDQAQTQTDADQSKTKLDDANKDVNNSISDTDSATPAPAEEPAKSAE